MARTIARFEVERELAATPLGTICKAKDPKSERMLALRTVRLDAPGAQEFLLRLKQRAKAASALNSPNIASIYGGGTDGSLFFVALEYVPGSSLRESIARGQRFSTSELIDLARQICSALDHAQHRNIFHPALHPGNILVEMDGTAKIMDFGIPKDLPTGDDARCAYVSPEQLGGAAPDLRSNLFSWGAILYELATGRKAFTGAERDTAPPAPQQINGAVPAGIGQAIMKALAKDPDQRHQRGSEFLAALENYKATAAPAAAPAPASPRSVRPPAPSAYAAMPPVPSQAPPREIENALPVAKPAPMAAPPPEPAPPVVEHVYGGPLPGTEKTDAPPPSPAVTTRAKAELKRAVHDAAATLRAPETERRVKQGLPYAVAAMAILTVVLLGLAAYYFVDGRLDAWRAQKASAPVAAPAPEPLPAPLAAEPEPAPPVVAEPEAGSLAAASVAVKRTRKRPVPVRGTTAPAPPTTGEVAITSVPEGALVQIDGQGDGSWRTPLVARSLSPGAHTITLTKPGYAAHAQAVPVEAGKRMAFAASLTELGATVAVTSSPPGAHILVDGKETGRLTPTKLVLPAGNHSFSLRRAGYFEYTSQAQLAAGQNAQVEAALKVMGNVDEVKTAGRFNKLLGRPKDMASLQIKTRPKGGRVVINGRTMEKNTPAEFFLPPGQYEVVVTVEGYQPLRKTVNLESASKTVVDQALQK